MTDEKRKRVSLPVIGQPRRAIEHERGDDVDLGDGAPTARSPTAWAFLGALFTFAVLVPLAMLGMAIAKAGGFATIAIVSVLSIGASAFAGGYLVGRFGGRAGPREGAISGALAGLVMAALGAKAGANVLVSLVILVVTVPCAALGARVGRRARKPGDTIGA